MITRAKKAILTSKNIHQLKTAENYAQRVLIFTKNNTSRSSAEKTFKNLCTLKMSEFQEN